MQSGRPIKIFVFGSNEAGIHGAGAARYAEVYKGAIRGIGYGHYGESFAIPTKDKRIQTLPLAAIETYVDYFIQYAKLHSEMLFQVTCIGCGLAGYEHGDIAPMFLKAPSNCEFDELWMPWLGPSRDYWGTF